MVEYSWNSDFRVKEKADDMWTVKHVLSGHLWDKERQVQFIWNFLWQDKKKMTF